MNTTDLSSNTWLGHPKGLFLLFTTELWERFSFYAMRAILVLYLTDKTLTDGGQGLGFTEADALSLYGTFTGLMYLTPLIGGWLADNIIGQRKAVMLGGILMATGQFLLGTPHAWLTGQEPVAFYLGLVGLVLGNGLFKPNISTMVGELYSKTDPRRDAAFTIFYMGINVGAFLSAIVVGSVISANNGNWQSGFVCAGIGMLISLLIQALWAQKLLGEIGTIPAAKRAMENKTICTEPLTHQERDRIKVIMVLGLFTIVFWAGFEQAGGLMTLFTNEFSDRAIGSFIVPTTWFQSLNPMFIIIFAPVLASLWLRMGQHEPNSAKKFALGLVLLAVGFLFMIGAVLEMGNDPTAKSSMLWLLGAYFFHTMAELCISPVGLSMVTKLAPLRVISLMMGMWFLFLAASSKIAGVVGSFIGHGGSQAQQLDNALSIFAGIAITATLSGMILYFLADKLVDWMHNPQDHTGRSERQLLNEEIAVTAEHEAISRSPER